MFLIICNIKMEVLCNVSEIISELQICFSNNISLNDIEPDYTLVINYVDKSSITVTLVNDMKEIIYNDTFESRKFMDIFVNQMLLYILRDKNIISFHASSFMYNNTLYIIIGKSGSGKTTFVLNSMLKNNAAYFSDDFTVFDLSNKMFMPFSRMFHIRMNTLKLLSLEKYNKRELFYKNDDDPYQIFFPAELGIKICSLNKSISDVCFVNIKYVNGTSTKLEIKEPIDSLQFLIRNCSNITSVNTNIIDFFKEAIKSGAQFYSLEYSDYSNAFDKLTRTTEEKNNV